MTEFTDEAVILFVDGGMTGAELAAFEARLASDASLAERVSAHRWMVRQIVAAYGSPPDEVVDGPLRNRLGLNEDNVFSFSAIRNLKASRAIGWSVAAGALAASLVIGVMVGQSMFAPANGIILGSNGKLVASGELSDRLSNQLIGEQGQVQIGVSFRAENGVCRTFHVQQGASGLGCREGEHWIVPIMVTDNPNPNGPTEYSLASGDIAPAVMAEVDRRIKGDPFTAAQEKQLQKSGWNVGRN